MKNFLYALLLVLLISSEAFCSIPVNIPASDIGLPTNGASIYSVKFVRAGEEGNPNGDFYRVNGAIHPVDPNTPDINFQVNLPLNWNKRLAHFGGGGFNGVLVTGEGVPDGLANNEIRPLASGYVTFGSDSGHYSRGWVSRWALDDEALKNFAHEQLKKTHDVALKIASEFYGQAPEKIYFIGGSNGGREALKVIQLYPEDYDGAVCLYPVLNWVLKAIHDSFNADKMHAPDKKGWFSKTEYEAVKKIIIETCDEIDGLKDGIISNPFNAEKKRDEIFAKLAEVLSPEQLSNLKNFYEPMRFNFTLPYGFEIMPGYLLSQVLSDGAFSQMSSSPETRDGSMEKFGDQVIQYQIVRGANFNPANFKPEEWQKEIFAASELLDAFNPNIEKFKERGGKLLLLHGGADQFVSLQGSIDYYNSLREKFGDELDNFMRFYFVPGYGHGRGDLFTMSRNLLADLDDWSTNNKAPDVLIIKDQNSNRTRPLYKFPGYAKYKGEGDVNSAESFECASLLE